MDCFDIYVHELLMNSPRNGKIRINEKRFDILDKIFDILRKISDKSYWLHDFEYSIIEYAKTTTVIDFNAYCSINNDFSTIDLHNIKDKVGKKFNIDLYSLHNNEGILFDTLQNIYSLLLELYKKEMGKFYKLLFDHSIIIYDIERDIINEYDYPLEPDPFTNGAECFDLQLENAYKFINDDILYNNYQKKVNGVIR